MLRIGVDMQNIWESIWLLKIDLWKAHKILNNDDALVQSEFAYNLKSIYSLYQESTLDLCNQEWKYATHAPR